MTVSLELSYTYHGEFPEAELDDWSSPAYDSNNFMKHYVLSFTNSTNVDSIHFELTVTEGDKTLLEFNQEIFKTERAH